MNNLKVFEGHVLNIIHSYEVMLGSASCQEKRVCIKSAQKSYLKCVEHFQDKNKNLHRWLEDEPLVFTDPITGCLIETNIGKDIEALYYFLEFCRRQNTGEEISDEFAEYLEYLARRSRYSAIWIEA